MYLLSFCYLTYDKIVTLMFINLSLTVFVSVGVTIGLELGHNVYWMMFDVFLGLFLFYMAHWQTYVTGTLRFSQ